MPERTAARRFYYATQLKTQPTTIALSSNVDEPIHFSYRRYLEIQFREALGLTGSPIHFVIRARKGMKSRAHVANHSAVPRTMQ